MNIIKNEIIVLSDICERINKNQSIVDDSNKYNYLIKDIKKILNSNKDTFRESNISSIFRENVEIYGELSTKYKDISKKYTDEVQDTVCLNAEENIEDIESTITDIYFRVGTVNNTLEYLISKDYIIDVLNFANADSCGGGVRHGSMAQEEELCRTSHMLYNSLQLFSNKTNTTIYDKDINWGSNNWYKRILYTPNVLFRRKDRSNRYIGLDIPYKASVITAAAPNMSSIPFSISNNNKILENNLQKVIKHIYNSPFDNIDNKKVICWRGFDGENVVDIPKPNEYISTPVIPTPFKTSQKRVLLLGPWGCGMFAPTNRSEYYKFMAEQFCAVLKCVENKYDFIYFTFMNNTDNIYVSFRDIFKKYFNLIEI